MRSGVIYFSYEFVLTIMRSDEPNSVSLCLPVESYRHKRSLTVSLLKIQRPNYSAVLAELFQLLIALNFLVAGACSWNNLPVDVISAPSLLQKRLKLHLFRLLYPGLLL